MIPDGNSTLLFQPITSPFMVPADSLQLMAAVLPPISASTFFKPDSQPCLVSATATTQAPSVVSVPRSPLLLSHCLFLTVSQHATAFTHVNITFSTRDHFQCSVTSHSGPKEILTPQRGTFHSHRSFVMSSHGSSSSVHFSLCCNTTAITRLCKATTATVCSAPAAAPQPQQKPLTQDLLLLYQYHRLLHFYCLITSVPLLYSLLLPVQSMESTTYARVSSRVLFQTQATLSVCPWVDSPPGA